MSQNTLHTHPISEAELAGMQHHADPLADKTIADILGDWPAGDVAVDAPQWARIDTVNRLFGEWTDNQSLVGWTAQGDGVDAPMARALNHYVQTAEVLPPWADAKKIERAEKLFMEHGALSCILLFCASLPECYVIPDLSSVLHTSGQLEQNAEYRIRSTAAMIFPVMMHGGLSQRGAGVAQVLKVRLIHATIRNLILHGSPQDAVKQLLAGGSGQVAPQALPAEALRQFRCDETHLSHLEHQASLQLARLVALQEAGSDAVGREPPGMIAERYQVFVEIGVHGFRLRWAKGLLRVLAEIGLALFLQGIDALTRFFGVVVELERVHAQACDSALVGSVGVEAALGNGQRRGAALAHFLSPLLHFGVELIVRHANVGQAHGNGFGA